jgi:hypothetical protein
LPAGTRAFWRADQLFFQAAEQGKRQQTPASPVFHIPAGFYQKKANSPEYGGGWEQILQYQYKATDHL